MEVSPLRRHAADALRRARKLPVGHARNDLRQLAAGLLWLEKRDCVKARVVDVATHLEKLEGAAQPSVVVVELAARRPG